MTEDDSLAPLLVRNAREEDAPRLIEMIAALAAHHGDTANVSAAALQRDLFGRTVCATSLIAEIGGHVVGYALLHAYPHVQFGLRLMDLNHLFVEASHRGRGIGRQLIAAAVAEARRQGCGRLVVGPHPENRAAQEIYRYMGFSEASVAGPRFRLDLPDGGLPAGWI